MYYDGIDSLYIIILCILYVLLFVGVLQSWSDWGEWSGSLRPCSEKVYQSRRRSCPHVTNPDGYPVTLCCNSSREDVEYSCCDGGEIFIFVM